MEFDDLSSRVIGCAMEVHPELGPGLLESTYEQCLAHELTLNGISFQLQHPQSVPYKGIHLDCGYRIDVFVENQVIIELKSVDEIKGIHEGQLLTYMKLAGVKIGLLMNFNVTKLKDGIKRFVLGCLRALRVLRGGLRPRRTVRSSVAVDPLGSVRWSKSKKAEQFDTAERRARSCLNSKSVSAAA